MKIVLVCPRSPREKFAGIENLVVQLAKGLEQKGCKTVILATAKKPRQNKWNGIQLKEFSSWAPNESYFFSPKLSAELKKEPADLVHCFGYNNLVTLLALLGKKKGTRLIITPASAGSSSALRKALLFPVRWLFRWNRKKMDGMVFLSEFEKNLFEKKWKIRAKQSFVIPIGIDFSSIPKETEKKHEIVSIGRLVKNKGFDRVLNVFALVAKKDLLIQLRIMGGGPEQENLKELASRLGIEKRVIFAGEIPFSQRSVLLNALCQAKAFLFLSRFESQGLVISEAVACKTPAIVFENSAQKEFVENGMAIGVKETDSNEKIAETVLKVIGNPKKFSVATKPLSTEEAVENHWTVYKKIVRQK